MHNIRKVKKKNKTKIMNPEEMAQQKLFEISNQEAEFKEPQFCIERPGGQSSIERRLPVVTAERAFREPRLMRSTSYQLNFSNLEMKRKEPLTLINYVVMDKKKTETTPKKTKEGSFQQICLSNIKRRMQVPRRKSGERAVKSLSSKKTQVITNEAVSSSFKIKNIKLCSQYPSYFPA